ncbi:hypothetical protein DIS24_g2751 [Lasiodiplodia hormozganensis]|uniref:Uncharacterized protein n=1 Tax=Lasiodiplodia hormozganensis TaxID=869390 RepID=A0AA39YZ89_9PEZI|nr:hypothetical protein DIS24_g2751 [Lasiodiplodia hormozganensis]
MTELETEEKIPSHPPECHVNEAVVDWEETVAFKLTLAYSEKYNLVLPISGKEPWTRDDHACEEEVLMERGGDEEYKEQAAAHIKEEAEKKDESVKDPLALLHHLGSVCEESLSLLHQLNSLHKGKKQGSEEEERVKEEEEQHQQQQQQQQEQQEQKGEEEKKKKEEKEKEEEEEDEVL